VLARLKRKSRLNPRQVRKYAQIENVLTELGIKFERRDLNLYAKCPNPDHKDKTPSWNIYSVVGHEKNGVFGCWSCKFSGDIFKLVMQLKKCDFPAAIQFVSKYSRVKKSIEKVETKDYYRDNRPYEPATIGYEWSGKKFKPTRIELGGACSEYLKSRWIGSQYVDMFGLRDWREEKRVIAPITRDGRLISWVGRSYNGQNPKTLAPAGAPKKWELFGYDQLDRTIPELNLVEGWVDAIRLKQICVPNAVALCGSMMTEFQVESILWASKITAWLDGDTAGKVMGRDTACWFTRNLWVVEMPDGTDPGHFSPNELLNFKPQKWRKL